MKYNEVVDMAYSPTAPTEYYADDLAKYIDVPEAFRGAKIQLIGPGASIARNGVVYYPFTSEEEVLDWIDAVSSEWWNDETV
jgi:hypothetical protein